MIRETGGIVTGAYVDDRNTKILGNPYLEIGLEFWWEVTDVESRIRAFDTLIKLYEDIDREFVW